MPHAVAARLAPEGRVAGTLRGRCRPEIGKRAGREAADQARFELERRILAARAERRASPGGRARQVRNGRCSESARTVGPAVPHERLRRGDRTPGDEPARLRPRQLSRPSRVHARSRRGQERGGRGRVHFRRANASGERGPTLVGREATLARGLSEDHPAGGVRRGALGKMLHGRRPNGAGSRNTCKIFGRNAARVYGVDVPQLRKQHAADAVSKARPGYAHSVGAGFRTHGPRTRREMIALLKSGLGH